LSSGRHAETEIGGCGRLIQAPVSVRDF